MPTRGGRRARRLRGRRPRPRPRRVGARRSTTRRTPTRRAFLADVCAEIADASGLRVAAIHRVGALAIGDVALVAAVAAPHRAEAFAVCAQLVDLIKERMPIWKRQHLADGTTEWVGL